MAVQALGSTPRVRVAPWNDPVIRGWVFQVVVVGLVGLLAWYLVSNTVDNLQRQKIASGFHYLEREAGFEIGDTMISYSPSNPSRHPGFSVFASSSMGKASWIRPSKASEQASTVR